MTRQPVASSNIKSLGHDGSTLEVEFTNGRIYRYAEVSPEVFQGLLGAESVGKHFNQNVKGRFVGEKVESEPK